ncbi:hypothetical protein LguiA_029630 [Lonicera macranthoides]
MTEKVTGNIPSDKITEYEIVEIQERISSFKKSKLLNRKILKKKLKTVKYECRAAKCQLKQELHELDLKLKVRLCSHHTGEACDGVGRTKLDNLYEYLN